MFKNLFWTGALSLVMMTGLVSGQDLRQQTKPQVIESAVKVPGTD
jgi:hypothetical protein